MVARSSDPPSQNDSRPYFAAPPRPTPHVTFPQLTARENEILDLIAGHFTNPEIADRLDLKPKTVRNHVSNIFNKLQVATGPRPSSPPVTQDLDNAAHP